MIILPRSYTRVKLFLQMDLIDEHRIMVNPVILGSGTPLFKASQKLNLKFVRTRTFGNGNVLLCYQPDRR